MRYFKSAAVGIMAALVIAVTALPIWVWLTDYVLERKLIAEIDLSQGGIGAEATDVNLLPVVGLALAAFVLGFFWSWRRNS